MLLSRRKFVKTMAIGAGVAFIPFSCTKENSPWAFFTLEEGTLVEAITDQLIPADDTPGAKYAGVVHFIDKQLMGYNKRFQEDYRNGLEAFQKNCKNFYNTGFHNLEWNMQMSYLEKIEAGTVDGLVWEKISPDQFFNMILDHTMQGFYGDPKHGGNKEYVSYKMLDLRVINF